MGDTSIEWAEKTWNPIRAELLVDILDKTGKIVHHAGDIGWFCIKCSPGCAGCYACSMNLWRGNGLEYTVPNRDKVRMFLDEKTLLEPLKWRTPKMVFPCSMTDWMEQYLVPDEWIDKMLAVMALTPQHTYLTLTKRADRQRKYFTDPGNHRRRALAENFIPAGGNDSLVTIAASRNRKIGQMQTPRVIPNLWLGTSCENQKYADERIPELLQTPAAVRWISAEPLLGPINLPPGYNGLRKMGDGLEYKWAQPFIDWIVCGGESGAKARPMHPDWARSIQNQCVAAGVPFFFKQWGEWIPGDHHDGCRVGKKASGRLLDGKEWNQYPEAKGRSIRIKDAPPSPPLS